MPELTTDRRRARGAAAVGVGAVATVVLIRRSERRRAESLGRHTPLTGANENARVAATTAAPHVEQHTKPHGKARYGIQDEGLSRSGDDLSDDCPREVVGDQAQERP
ncbi:hypothetical protein ACH5A3_08365 [Streptomyces echinatus]|uniref:hypothetical protein n=1 Tax=Streptomyces echinatus TaxID=67293 RepID=UPI0037A2602A